MYITNLNAIVAAGTLRLKQEAKGENHSLPAVEVSWHGSEEKFLNRQHAVFGDNLDVYNLELLRRSKRLLDHMDCNIGESDDWPILLVDADQQHHELVADLRAMVGCLTEV